MQNNHWPVNGEEWVVGIWSSTEQREKLQCNHTLADWLEQREIEGLLCDGPGGGGQTDCATA